MNLYVGWWRGRQASLKSDLLGSSGKLHGILSLEHWASCCAGDAQQARVALLVGPRPASFTAVCLGILCSGSSRQIVLQSSVPPAAIQFTSTLSFLYMTAGKQILPACRCALRIIKFGSIQHLICQAEFFSPPPFSLERIRTYKHSCLHTRAAAPGQIYPTKLFFSFSFRQQL